MAPMPAINDRPRNIGAKLSLLIVLKDMAGSPALRHTSGTRGRQIGSFCGNNQADQRLIADGKRCQRLRCSFFDVSSAPA
jgi:hypothetical protein